MAVADWGKLGGTKPATRADLFFVNLFIDYRNKGVSMHESVKRAQEVTTMLLINLNEGAESKPKKKVTNG